MEGWSDGDNDEDLDEASYDTAELAGSDTLRRLNALRRRTSLHTHDDEDEGGGDGELESTDWVDRIDAPAEASPQMLYSWFVERMRSSMGLETVEERRSSLRRLRTLFWSMLARHYKRLVYTEFVRNPHNIQLLRSFIGAPPYYFLYTSEDTGPLRINARGISRKRRSMTYSQDERSAPPYNQFGKIHFVDTLRREYILALDDVEVDRVIDMSISAEWKMYVRIKKTRSNRDRRVREKQSALRTSLPHTKDILSLRVNRDRRNYVLQNSSRPSYNVTVTRSFQAKFGASTATLFVRFD